MKSCDAEKVDFLIVGSGVAAMRCALALGNAGNVLMITKQSAPAQPSKYANGVLAAISSDEEEIRLHYDDTLCAGEGLCNPEAVKVLLQEGPGHIEELSAWGAQFERDTLKTLAPKEGAKPRSCTYRAKGQSTILELLSVLNRKIASMPNVKVRTDMMAEDLILKGGAVAGLHCIDMKTGQTHSFCAKAVFIGTGGMGQLYPETTNSPQCTGDGLAVAFRAGAELSDMEFIQFHPTVLCLKNAPRILLPESLRAEGAYLRNVDLQRFMHRYHDQEELAPREVLSRAIMTEMAKTQSNYVYLDCTHLDAEKLQHRFPGLFQTFADFNFDISENMIPIHPAAHYCIGGIKIDTSGRASLGGLFAAGEVACSGLHGSNRLPSNSLLESLVFGARAGQAMKEMMVGTSAPVPVRPNGHPEKCSLPAKAKMQVEEKLAKLKRLMWDHVGIIRSGQQLRQTLQSLRDLSQHIRGLEVFKHEPQLRNLISVADIVTQSALAREESRGAHYREDFPLRKDPHFLKHSVISKDSEVAFS
ncbi:MAG: FAD-binding protein [Acidobacteriia bacterium]|nr:FAD-binding protein [Terriglobia bacterium]